MTSFEFIMLIAMQLVAIGMAIGLIVISWREIRSIKEMITELDEFEANRRGWPKMGEEAESKILFINKGNKI